jgi:hypothetical protein
MSAAEHATRPDRAYHDLRARAAQAGVSLYRCDDDGRGIEVFVIARWNLSRELRSLGEVEAWLDRLEGRAL